ncbi:MAG: histidine-type phosphatase [Candidatus Baltobacteraceae bacterium]
MNSILGVLLAIGLLGVAPANAVSPAPSELAAQPLTFAVVLTRHGVRSPTHTPVQYTWPDWQPDAQGYLTKRGYALATMMGKYYGEYFGARGLPLDCTSGNAYVYADIDQRTIETGRALIEGLCANASGLPLNHSAAIASNTPDTLFDNAGTSEKRAAPTPATQAVEVQQRADFNLFQTLLNERCYDTCSTIGTGSDALHTASGYAENIFLEYAQCRPLAEIAPVDSPAFLPQLQAAMRLHVDAYDAGGRAEPAARDGGGNMLAHIIGLLEQKAGAAHPGVNGPDMSATNVAFIVGHDTQIGNIAGILGAHWDLGDSMAPDDMPPGGALIFELYRDAGDTPRVRLAFAHQTLAQMRSGSRITGGELSEPVQFAGCTQSDCSMPLSELAAKSRALVKAGVVRAAWTPPSNEEVDLPPLVDPAWTKCEN